MQANTLSGGFANPAIGSAHAFRRVMEAMARPGTIQDVEGAAPPAPMSPAMGAVLLTLCDTETPVYLAGDLDCDAVRAWLSFHTGAPFCRPRALYVCGWRVGRAGAAHGLPDRHIRIPGPLGNACRRMFRAYRLGRNIDRARHQGSGNAFLAGSGRVSGQPRPVPAGAGFHFHLRRTPRGFAPVDRGHGVK